jgi:transcription elongation GreA/GreB family factor
MITDNPAKQNIHRQCLHIVAAKLELLQLKLRDLTESAANETKSSAGDKYETGLAMLHIEQEQVQQQVSELLAQQAVLNSIDPTVKTERVVLGSLVSIAEDYYYLSVGLGRMVWEGKIVIALSLQSPLGTRLKGLTAGDSLMINGKTLRIDALQ